MSQDKTFQFKVNGKIETFPISRSKELLGVEYDELMKEVEEHGQVLDPIKDQNGKIIGFKGEITPFE